MGVGGGASRPTFLAPGLPAPPPTGRVCGVRCSGDRRELEWAGLTFLLFFFFSGRVFPSHPFGKIPGPLRLPVFTCCCYFFVSLQSPSLRWPTGEEESDVDLSNVARVLPPKPSTAASGELVAPA